MSNIIDTFVIILTIIICTLIIIWFMGKNKELDINYSKLINPDKNSGPNGDTDKCTTTCDALDPVSDPRYNMQQIIKQSILLEEHLTNKIKDAEIALLSIFYTS